MLLALAMAVSTGCGRKQTNTYEIEFTAPTESERVRVQFDRREIASFPGFELTMTLSRDEATPFPYEKPPLALKAEIFGPDGWVEAPARIELLRSPESVERDLAAGIMLPLRIYIEKPSQNFPLYVYVDNRGQAQETRIALGQAERVVAAGKATKLIFLRPTSDQGKILRVGGVEVGRVHVPAQADIDKQTSWLVDVSGQHTYRQRAVFYHDRRSLYSVPYKKDDVKILRSARLYSIPKLQIDYFLEHADSSIAGPDLDLSMARIEVLDVK